ncbi:hypothetical protein [Nonomuraea sp. JJY05]|uniref:hypothetical protein n=1 Tax=Nonomuraea sp. JJY05 TaxID=3350255 RepID=UPI00373E7738
MLLEYVALRVLDQAKAETVVDRSRHDVRACAQPMDGRALAAEAAEAVVTPDFYLSAIAVGVPAVGRLTSTYGAIDRCPLGASPWPGRNCPSTPPARHGPARALRLLETGLTLLDETFGPDEHALLRLVMLTHQATVRARSGDHDQAWPPPPEVFYNRGNVRVDVKEPDGASRSPSWSDGASARPASTSRRTWTLSPMPHRGPARFT